MFSTIKVKAFLDADYEFLVSRNVVNIFASTLDFFDAKLESNEFSFRDHNLLLVQKENYISEFDNQVLQLRQNYTDEELITYFDYSQLQVNAIRNFDFTNEMRILASAQITSSLYASEYIYSNSTNKTYLTARYNFTLQGVDTSV